MTLDVTGMPCPMPIIKLKKFLSERGGEIIKLKLMASDYSALKDVPAFCSQQNIKCEFLQDNDGILEFEVLVGLENV